MSSGGSGNATDILRVRQNNRRSSLCRVGDFCPLWESGCGRNPTEPPIHFGVDTRNAARDPRGLASVTGPRRRAPRVSADFSAVLIGIIVAAAARRGGNGIVAAYLHRQWEGTSKKTNF